MKTMDEVLKSHWSASTHTDRKPFVDKCDGCGEVIMTWGQGGDMPALLVAHQAAALTAAGFGPVREAQAQALRDAADELTKRSDTLANTTQNMANDGGYGYAEVARYAAYSAEADTTAHILRARAAAVEGGT